MGDEVVSEVGSAEEETLDLVIETQLPDRHQDLQEEDDQSLHSL